MSLEPYRPMFPHCKKITASDVARLGVRNKALVPTPGITIGSNRADGDNPSLRQTGAVNFPLEVDQDARLAKLIEGPDTEVLDC
jgi:hypothetical protein